MNSLKVSPTMCATILFASIHLSISIYKSSASELKELDTVLKNYDKRVRPLRNTAPVEVKVQIALEALGPIDTKAFTFEVDFYLREFWTDPRIDIQNDSVIVLNGNPNLFLWVPDLFILNADDTKIHKMVTDPISTIIYKGGRIFISSATHVSFACSMDLHMFPMDSQICSLELESYAHDYQNLKLGWKDKPLDYDKKSIKVPGFTVINITTDSCNYTYATNYLYSRLRMSFHIDRTFSYYFYRTYLPSIALVILSWGSFQIPATAYPARITLILTNFLASTVILQHACSEYTKVEYTTAIEIFLLVNICFIMITMLEYMIVLHLHPDIKMPWSKIIGKKENEKKCNIEMAKSSHCNINVFEDGEYSDFALRGKNSLAEVKTSKEKDKSKAQKLHNIDRASRLIIPTAYIVFNITYFAYFLPKGKEHSGD